MNKYSPEHLLEAVNAVTAKNELLPGLNTSVIRFPITESGLVDPIRKLPIRKSFDFSSSWEARISEFNLAMLEEAEKGSGIGLWLSPPDKIHKTGKILVAVHDGETVVEYDTTGLTFSGKDFASFMACLSPFYRDGYCFLPNDGWQILEEVISMPKVWEGIRNDQLEMKFNRDVKEALEHAGGDVRLIFREKFGVDIAEACQTDRGVNLIMKLVAQDGKVNELHYVHNCGECGAKIERFIRKGAICKEVVAEDEKIKGRGCDKIYMGC